MSSFSFLRTLNIAGLVSSTQRKRKGRGQAALNLLNGSRRAVTHKPALAEALEERVLFWTNLGLFTTSPVTTVDTPVAPGTSMTVSVSFAGSGFTDPQPTGTVTFVQDGTAVSDPVPIPEIAGHITAVVTGSITVIAPAGFGNASTLSFDYSGDSYFSGGPYPDVNSTTIYVIHPPATPTVSVAASANPVALGQSVTLTAAVSGSDGTPTGDVQFIDDGSVIGSVSLESDGTASLDTFFANSGDHTITASYMPDDDSDYAPATSDSETETVTALPTPSIAISTSANPVDEDVPVTFTAILDGNGNTPTGTVQFLDGGTALPGGPVEVDPTGTATLVLPSGFSEEGDHVITASYNGDTNYSPTESSTATETVIPPSVFVNSVTTTDSKSLTISYTVSDNDGKVPFALTVYRSSQATYNIASGQATIADVTATGDLAKTGTQQVVIGSGAGAIGNFNQQLALRPDPTHKYVIATADDDGSANIDDLTTTPQAGFRIWLIGAVTHGYVAGAGPASNTLLPTNFEAPYQDFVDEMAGNLTKGGYDASINFHWEDIVSLRRPNQTVIAGIRLANDVVDSALDLHVLPNDVIDVNLIGWSRGAVAVNQAMRDLSGDNVGPDPDLNWTMPNVPELARGFYSESLVDPHPANNSISKEAIPDTYLANPLDIAARAAIVAGYRNFQRGAQDGAIVVGSKVQAVSDLYQNQYNSGLPDGERFLNLWGLTPDQITSTVPIIPHMIKTPGIGHTEIMLQTEGDIIAQGQTLKELHLDPFVNDVITSPMSLSSPVSPETGARPAVRVASVTPAVLTATTLAVTANPPATVSAGLPFGLTVAAEDGSGSVDSSFNGMVTIALDPNPNGGSLDGTLSVAAVNGVATFSGLSLYELGDYTISATALGLTGTTTSTFTVNPAPATQLIVNLPSGNVLTNAPFSLTVDATDAFGRVDPSFSGSITLSLLKGAGATLGGTLTVAAVNGVATFDSLTINQPGSADVIAATASSLATGVTTPFAVYNDQLVVTTQPSDSVASANGAGFGLVVTAENASGNTDTSFNGPVTVSVPEILGDTADEVRGNTTVTAINGVATFANLVIAGSGQTQLMVGGNGIGSANTNFFNITPGQATQLEFFQPPPTDVTATATFTVQIAALDPLNNIDTSYTGNITLTLAANPGSAMLGGTLTVAAVGGVASFTGLTLSASGNGYTLTASSNALASATTALFIVTPVGAAAQLVFSTEPPDTITAGTPFSVVVQAQDDLGTLDTSFNGMVTISEFGGATIGGTLSVAAVNGVATFNGLAINQAGGLLTLIASSSPLVSGSATQTIVTIGAATKFSVSAPTSAVQPGVPFSVTVNAVDSLGNINPSYSGTVTISLVNGSGAVLGGTLSAMAVAGVANFSGLTLSAAGTGDAIAATGNLTTGTSDPFDVTTDVLVVTTQPPQILEAGDTFGFSVSANGTNGAVDTAFNGPVTVALLNVANGSPVLNGTLTVNAVNGVATFSGLSVSEAGSDLLTVSSSGVAGTTTDTIAVAPARTPSTTTVTVSPTSIPFGEPATFTATVSSGAGGSIGEGTVTFFSDGNALGAFPVQNDGTAVLTVTAGTPGVHSVTASFGGNGLFAPSAISSAASVTVGPQSTATPSLSKFVLPAVAVVGQPIKAKLPVVITNGGADLKGSFSVVLFVDTNSSLDGSRVQLGKLSRKLTLKSGRSATVPFNIRSLPGTLPAGSYHFIAEVVDPTGATNVGASGTLAVQAPIVTLNAVGGVVKPGVVKLKHAGTATVTITDTGNIDAVGSLVIVLSPSSDGATPVAGITLASVHRKIHLLHGHPMKVQVPFKVTASLPANSYQSYFSITLGNVVTTAVGGTFSAG